MEVKESMQGRKVERTPPRSREKDTMKLSHAHSMPVDILPMKSVEISNIEQPGLKGMDVPEVSGETQEFDITHKMSTLLEETRDKMDLHRQEVKRDDPPAEVYPEPSQLPSYHSNPTPAYFSETP